MEVYVKDTSYKYRYVFYFFFLNDKVLRFLVKKDNHDNKSLNNIIVYTKDIQNHVTKKDLTRVNINSIQNDFLYIIIKQLFEFEIVRL